MMRAVIYARVSSARQRDAESIKSQLHVLREFVKRQGWELVDVYEDDGRSAKTGKLDKREAWARLMRDAEAGRFSVLVVLDINRLTRTESIEERAAILGPLQRLGIDIYTPSSGRTDLRSFLGEFYATLQAMVASEENRKRATAVKAGKDRAIAEGRKPAGPTPFGYAYDRHAPAGAWWSIDPDHGPIVVEIFERALRGESCEAIAADLEGRGLARPRGGAWSRERVYQIVTSRSYLGAHVVDKRRGLSVPVPRIIEDDLWHAVDAQLSRHGKRGLRRTKGVYLLENIAVCELCGAPINISSHGGTSPATYVCRGRRRPERGQLPCTLPHRRIDDVDAAIWDQLSSVLARPDLIELAIGRRSAAASKDGASWRDDLKAAEQRLERLGRSEQAILARFRRGLISEAAMDAELKAQIRERSMLDRQVATARRAAGAADRAGASVREVAALISKLRGALRSSTPEQRRALVATLLGDVPVVVGAVDVRARFRLTHERPAIGLVGRSG